MFLGTECHRYNESKTFNPNLLSLAIKLKAVSIKRFTSGKLHSSVEAMHEEMDQQMETPATDRKNSARIQRQSSVAEQITMRVRTRRSTLSALTQHEVQKKKKKIDVQYYLTVVAEEELFKFFPFTAEEIEPLCAILTDMTGLVPFDESELIKAVLVSFLDLNFEIT